MNCSDCLVCQPFPCNWVSKKIIIYLTGQARLLNQIHTTLSPVTRPKVAFYAQLTKDLVNIGNYQAIIFDLATTNMGGHYNSNDGIFTAPQDGTYVFSWTAANTDRSHMQTELVVNGHIYGRTWSDSMDHSDRSIASNTVVLNLHTKDAVWIRSNNVHSHQLMGNLMSTFSGWLLYDR